MPTSSYYECSKGHLTEKFFMDSQEGLKPHRCLFEVSGIKCKALAKRNPFISRREAQNALRFKPIEFFIKDGEVVNIGCSLHDLGKLSLKVQKKMKKYISNLEKKGYSFQALSTFAEYQKFKNEYNQRLTLKNFEEAIGMDMAYSTYIKRELDDLKYGFTLQYPDGSSAVIPPLDKFDHPEVAQLARDLMEDRPISQEVLDSLGDSKLAQDIRELNSPRSRNYDAGFHIESMENDSGGRDRRSWI